MNELTIYHNPRCSKSRKTLQIIKDNGIQPTVVEYLKKPLKKFELENISRLLNNQPQSSFNNPFTAKDSFEPMQANS